MTRVKLYIILIFSFGFYNSYSTEGYFELSDSIRAAYQSICQLKLNKAENQVARIKRNEPNNMMVYYIENYIDFYVLFIGEEGYAYNLRKKNKDYRIEQIKTGNKNSPYYNFCIAEVYLQWALVRLKFGERFTPMQEIFMASKLLEDNDTMHPNFVLNKKSLSIIHSLAESIPGLVKTLFRISGDIKKGTEEIFEVLEEVRSNPDFMWKEESYAIAAYILFYQNNKKTKAYELLKSAELNISNSPLLTFLMAGFAQKIGHNEEAIQILEDREKDNDRFPFYYLELMYGEYLLNKLDSNAIYPILFFINHFEGRHYIKKAYQKLAWYYLVFSNDIEYYNDNMNNIKIHGYELVDEDKHALKQSKSKKIPHRQLLKARLLFDGAYYKEAFNLLVELTISEIENEGQELEYYYRMARVCQGLEKISEAIDYYNKTIIKGGKHNHYFVCNALLQLGYIYESLENYILSKEYYKKCLKSKPNEFKNSIHQKAKLGLERIKLLNG